MKLGVKMFVIALAFSAASSDANAQVDLSWNACVGNPDAAVNKVFDCAGTQNRNYSLMIQFKSPVPLPRFVALTGYLDLGPWGAPLSPYWHYENGGCNAIGRAVFDEIPPACQAYCYGDPWDDGTSSRSTIAAYVPEFQTTGRGRFVLLTSRDMGHPIQLERGVNYFGVELRLNNRNRSACAGCLEPKMIVLNTARLESDDGSPALELSGADKGSDCVTINSASELYCYGHWPEPHARTDPPCGPTPVTRRTWGMLKTLYR